jgi:hypothetical protein
VPPPVAHAPQRRAEQNTGAMRPGAPDIAVPPFAPTVRWIGPEPPAVERICATGPLLVHFVDAAHFSSVRTLPYVRRWHERYRDLGLTVVGVNSPRFPFTGDARKLEAALVRLAVDFPVAVDSEYAIWHDYGCEGWPSLFLWSRGGALVWFHFGEGDYAATELAIQEQLRGVRRHAALPEPLAPLRASDAPGALVARPTAEVFPGGSTSNPWHATGEDDRIELDYEGGSAWASVDGRGTLHVSLDRGPATATAVEAPGAYEIASHRHSGRHRLSLRPSPGLSLYSVGFGAGVPA